MWYSNPLMLCLWKACSLVSLDELRWPPVVTGRVHSCFIIHIFIFYPSVSTQVVKNTTPAPSVSVLLSFLQTIITNIFASVFTGLLNALLYWLNAEWKEVLDSLCLMGHMHNWWSISIRKYITFPSGSIPLFFLRVECLERRMKDWRNIKLATLLVTVFCKIKVSCN